MRNYRILPRDQLPTLIPAPAVIVREDPLAMRARHVRLMLDARLESSERMVKELSADCYRLYLLWQRAEADLRVLRAEREVQ